MANRAKEQRIFHLNKKELKRISIYPMMTTEVYFAENHFGEKATKSRLSNC